MNVRREWFPGLLLDHGIWPEDIERRLSPAQWEATRSELMERDREARMEHARRAT